MESMSETILSFVRDITRTIVNFRLPESRHRTRTQRTRETRRKIPAGLNTAMIKSMPRLRA
jgi:hypothetical protein